MAFSKPIVVFGNGKMPDGDMLQIKVIKDEEADNKRKLSSDAPHVEKEEEATFKWKCTEFTASGLGIEMDFGNPLGVSQNNKSPDKLSIALAPNTFFAEGSYESVSGEMKLDIVIPKQFKSPEEAEKSRAITWTIKTVMYSAMGLCFLMSLMFD